MPSFEKLKTRLIWFVNVCGVSVEVIKNSLKFVSERGFAKTIHIARYWVIFKMTEKRAQTYSGNITPRKSSLLLKASA